ncbi:MAG: haloacid dehalogenase [Candidatus Marinimicrobia bacterium CG08_land_8_20_14_0_20_45_22]|nr:MAG: haloacid dehalogenase [Candidatus Marinimicrobia bacterium CG08_land_8_20_14_0_20_45_22]
MVENKDVLNLPGLGKILMNNGMKRLVATSDGTFHVGKDDVQSIISTGDGKVEFVSFPEKTLACVLSAMGYPAYYPVLDVEIKKPVKAVLMDLDGTSVKSEGFWVWIIQQSISSLLGNPKFELSESDLPYVSGHSVSEHLQHCIAKYCPDKTVEDARVFYFEHTRREMKAILDGNGRVGAFTPRAGLKEFLLKLKEQKIKIGLVTSGLYEKAYPEILSAFRTLDMGDPAEFYDVIITAGFPLKKGSVGTLGELSPKPHPWLYAEVSRVGLGIPFSERHHVVGIEDSGAGIVSIRLAGFSAIGISDGNIEDSRAKALCNHYCRDLDEVLRVLL